MLKTILVISLLFSYLKGEAEGGEKETERKRSKRGVEGDAGGGGSAVDVRRGGNSRCTLAKKRIVDKKTGAPSPTSHA